MAKNMAGEAEMILLTVAIGLILTLMGVTDCAVAEPDITDEQ